MMLMLYDANALNPSELYIELNKLITSNAYLVMCMC